MKKQLILITSLCLLYWVSFSSAIVTKAQEATSSGSPTPAETTVQLKERIQRIVEENSDQIKGVIDQLSYQKRGFIGRVERVTQESLTLENRKGTQIISIDEKVTLLKSNQEISIDDVAVDDWLVVMGVIEDDTFSPKRILVSSTSLRPKNHFVIIGTITDQSNGELNLLSRQSEELSFDINKKTQYQDQDGETGSSKEFIKDLQVLVVGYEDDSGKNATTIRSLVSLETLQDNE
jgi:hypothetical protein